MKKILFLVLISLIMVLPSGNANVKGINHSTQITYQDLYQEILDNDIRFPEIVFAQAVLETGHFTSELFLTGNNLFGMKVPKKRKTYSLSNMKNGYAVFEDWTYSVKDYLLWQDYVLKNKKISSDKEYLKLLNRIYAKNKNYSKLLKSVVSRFQYLFNSEAEVAHSVEHDLAKVGVASSSLVFRSISPSSSAGRATDL